MRTGAWCIRVALMGCLATPLVGCGNTSKNGDEAGDSATTSDTTGITANGGNNTGDAGTTTGSGASGTGGATTGDETSSTGGTGGIVETCTPGIPVTSQLPRLLNREYDNILFDVLGVSSLAGGAPPSALLDADFEGDMTNSAWERYLEAARQVAKEVMTGDNRSRFMSCDPGQVVTCYTDTIATFGRRMFRRPLTQEEVARFMTLTGVDPSWTHEQISEAILFAFLASPSFIMVPELSAETEGTAFKLSSHEVAARLSLMLWSSVPDDELAAAADQGALVTSDQIRAQAERMIQLRDKAGPQISASHEGYLGIPSGASHWWLVDHDPELFPDYTEATRAALQAEVAAFFEELAYAGGSFRDIFLSNVAFVNQDSAVLYDLDASEYGSELTRVDLDETRRPGILTRAGFLSSYSSRDATNPILRGAFVTREVLGVDPGPPTADAFLVDLPQGPFLTQREKAEAHTSVRADCAACHAVFNPAGFVLENYDAVGRWQEVDPLGGSIDPTAEVAFAGDSVKTIGSPHELMQAIVDDPAARRLYAQKLVSFFTGRDANGHDFCAVEAIAAKLETSNDYSMLDIVVDLTQADSFRLRVASE